MKPAMRAYGAAGSYAMHLGAVSPVAKTVANFRINFPVNIASAPHYHFRNPYLEKIYHK